MIRQAVILAGGEGTRLRPVTLEIPKPLVPVQGLPILTWQARWFARHNVERVLVIIVPRWRNAFAAWRASVSEPSVELWEESEPMGTMGALAHHLRDAFNNESVFVTNGDELKGFDLDVLATTHERLLDARTDHAATLGLVRVEEPSHYGIPVMRGDVAIRYEEKPDFPSSDLAHAGLYALNTRTLGEADAQKTFLMFEKDFFPQMAEAGRLGGCALEGPWYDCGTMERWEKAIREWREPGIGDDR